MAPNNSKTTPKLPQNNLKQPETAPKLLKIAYKASNYPETP
jgi:hypothetical protein